MSGKFDCLGVDEGTRIVFRRPLTVSGLDAMHEKWVWEGIVGESVVFASDDVRTLGDRELEVVVCALPFCDGETGVTISRGEKYTFVNFNFRD